MKHPIQVLCSALLVVLLAPAPGSAYDFNLGNDRDIVHLGLRGIQAVAVHLSGFDYDYRRYGVEESRVRTAVEKQLRDAGLTVLSEEDAYKTPGAALLRVELHVNRNTYGYYSYATNVNLQQKIPLGTGPESFITETVWSRGTNGLVNTIEFRRVNTDIDGLLVRFIAEHREQNGAVSLAP